MTPIEIVRGVEGALGSARPWLATNGGDGRRDVFHVPFDPAEDDVIAVVVRSVSAIHNVEPAELPPLSDVVNPDALTRLVHAEGERSDAGTQVTFVYQRLEITVGADGNLWLEWV